MLKHAKLIANYIQDIDDLGISVRETSDYESIPSIVEGLDKSYLTPNLSPLMNDFTETNCFWLILERDDQVVAMCGVRLDNLGSEKVSKYWPRILKRQYGGGKVDQVHCVAEHVDQELGGRVAYFGDLYASREVRGSLKLLLSAVRICHLLVSTKWDPDYTYAFIREVDANRGAVHRYGFTKYIPRVQLWIDPPSPRVSSEGCAILSRRDLEYWVSLQD